METHLPSLAFRMENGSLDTIMNADIKLPISEPWELLVMRPTSLLACLDKNSNSDMAPCRFL